MHAEPFAPAGVTWSSVSPALATERRLVTAGFLGVVGVALVAIATTGDRTWAWIGAAVVAVLLAWSWWVIGRQVRALGYAERDDDLLVRRGTLWRTIVVVPYGRLQYVDVEAGPLDRAFGLARVQLHTASAGTDAAIPGLPPEEAARLRDRLTERGRSRLAGL